MVIMMFVHCLKPWIQQFSGRVMFLQVELNLQSQSARHLRCLDLNLKGNMTCNTHGMMAWRWKSLGSWILMVLGLSLILVHYFSLVMQATCQIQWAHLVTMTVTLMMLSVEWSWMGSATPGIWLRPRTLLERNATDTWSQRNCILLRRALVG